jgi:hypothetical protein
VSGKGRKTLSNEKLEILVSDNVKIKEYDDKNYILMKLVKNKNNQTGEMVENWKNFGYFSTIKKAIMGILYKDLLINNDEIETILDYKHQLDKQYETILELLKEK